MKSMRPNLVAIFFMTYFYRTRGAMAPSASLDPLPLPINVMVTMTKLFDVNRSLNNKKLVAICLTEQYYIGCYTFNKSKLFNSCFLQRSVF